MSDGDFKKSMTTWTEAAQGPPYVDAGGAVDVVGDGNNSNGGSMKAFE